MVTQEEKNPEEADRCSARALEIAPKDVRALTGRALAAMEREGTSDGARGWLDRVDPAERGDATVLLAEARWSRLSGGIDESVSLFRRSLEQLDEDGLPDTGCSTRGAPAGGGFP